MNSPYWNSFSMWVSPSNVAIALLVGFLFFGRTSDWKMLRARPATSSVAFANFRGPGLRTLAQQERAAAGASCESRTTTDSVVADNRPATRDSKRRQEID